MAAAHGESMRETVRSSIRLEDRLIVALDVPTVADARNLIGVLGGAVGFYKIGLQLIFAGGVELARDLVAMGKNVFLDAKLLDIDNQVANAVESIARVGVTFLTVHGNTPTVRAAVAARGESPLRIFAVTALTSMDQRDLADIGSGMTIDSYVMHRAQQALEAGADGVIASGREARAIRERLGDRLLIVTPGIRSEGVAHDDQKRVATPIEAIRDGADHLVVGREILRAPNPVEKVAAIMREIERGLSR